MRKGIAFSFLDESYDRATLVENQSNTKQMPSRESGGKSCDVASSCTRREV